MTEPQTEARCTLLNAWQEDGIWPPPSMAPRGGWTPPRLVHAIQQEVRAPLEARIAALEGALRLLASIECRCEIDFTARGRHASDCTWRAMRDYVDPDALLAATPPPAPPTLVPPPVEETTTWGGRPRRRR